jgi:hypothetical protein
MKVGKTRGNVQREIRTVTGSNIVSSIADPVFPGPAGLQTITRIEIGLPAKSDFASWHKHKIPAAACAPGALH